MNLLHLILESAAVHRLGVTLLHSLWEGALVAAVLFSAGMILRRSTPAARYSASCAALLLMVLAPLCTYFLINAPVNAVAIAPHPQLPAEPQAPAPGQATISIVKADHSVSPRPMPATVHQFQPRIHNAADTPAPTPTQSISPSVYLSTASPWIVLSWALGVLALALWNLGGWVAVHQLKSLTTRPAGSRAEEAARKLALRLGVSRPVRLLQSTLAKTPLVIGAIRPVILLPASVLTQLSLAELESILAHELAHIRRHDYVVNLVQSMIETLLFYHPATWWISRQIRIEREHCCDDLALSVTRDRAIYVTALAAVASVRVTLLAPAASGGSLTARLRRVLGMPDPCTTRSQWLSGAMVIALCSISLLLAAFPHSASANDDDTVIVRGRVQDPTAHPVAGASISAINFYGDQPLAQASTAADGSYEITFRKSQVKDPRARWENVTIVANAPGFGPDWNRWDQVNSSGGVELTLRADDVPIDGRILDLEGKPVQGVRIAVYNVMPKVIDLKTADIQGYDDSYLRAPVVVLPGHALGLSNPILTDAQGRFHINGIGRDRTASLNLAGPGIRRDSLQVVTRLQPAVSRSVQSYLQVNQSQYGATFNFTATPARVVTGVIRDAKTHEPLAGVNVISGRSRYLTHIDDVVSDAAGHYRIDGVPKGKDVQLLIAPNDDQPYFMQDVPVPDAPGLEPINIDVNLTRGIWITGKVTNMVTGAPAGDTRIYYLPYTTNKNAFATPEFHHDKANFQIPGDETRYTSKADGTYRIVALPGQAIVAGWAMQPYRMGLGGDQIKAPPLQPKSTMFLTYRPWASRTHPSTLKEVDIPEGVEQTTVDLPLDPGVTIHLTTVGPDGKPLTGVASLHDQPTRPFDIKSTSTFDAVAFGPSEKRVLWFWHMATKTGKVISITPDDVPSRQLTVKLEPVATLKGRLLDKDGQPLANARIQVSMDSPPAGTDSEGRFTLTVVPGMKYHLSGIKGRDEFDTDAHDIEIVPGGSKDLGDVHYKSYR